MSWILDIIILAIIGLTVFISYKNGFVKTLISAGAFIIAIILTSLLSSPVASLIKSTPMADAIRESTEEKIASSLLESTPDDLLDGKNEDFNALLNFAELDSEDIAEYIDAENAAHTLAEKIAEPIIDIAASIIAVIIIYISTQIVLSICGKLLDKIANLPILRTFNKIGGIALGIVLAVFRVFLFCFLMRVLIEVGTFTGSEFLMSFDTESTILFDLISNVNIFSFFI